MKTINYGLKNIASVLVAKGLTMGYTATPNPKYDVDSGDEDLDEDENVNAQKKSE